VPWIPTAELIRDERLGAMSPDASDPEAPPKGPMWQDAGDSQTSHAGLLEVVR
jgi:hypothetical protein